jgi:hypothetical protein
MSSIPFLTLFHSALLGVVVVSGVLVIKGLMSSAGRQLWALLFLVSAAVATLTGLFFPFYGRVFFYLTGVASLVPLLLMYVARYQHRLSGPWRGTYIIGAILVFYFHTVLLTLRIATDNTNLLVGGSALVCLISGYFAFKNYRLKEASEEFSTAYVSPRAEVE